MFYGGAKLQTKPVVNLVVVAHPDDEILGFGATGASLVSKGEIVQAIILSGQVEARSGRPSVEVLLSNAREANKLLGFNEPVIGNFPNLRMRSCSHLELVKFIEEQIHKFQPSRIFTHHPGDLNQDHTEVATACMAAARLFQRIQGVQPLSSLSCMEILSSTDWSFPASLNTFSPNSFIEIEETLDLKILALSKYKNVMRDFPHPRSIEIIKGLAAYRGGQCGLRYAEAFQSIFSVGF